MQQTEYEVTDNQDGTVTITSVGFSTTTWTIKVVGDGLQISGTYTSKLTGETTQQPIMIAPVDSSTIECFLG